MMSGINKIGKSNSDLLPMMKIGDYNFANILKKQKFSREYIDLKIENKISLTAHESNFIVTK
jgi:hypothetical protein